MRVRELGREPHRDLTGAIRLLQVVILRTPPLVGHAMYRRESSPRRCVVRIERDRPLEHPRAVFEVRLLHAVQPLPAAQIVFVRLRGRVQTSQPALLPPGERSAAYRSRYAFGDLILYR